MVSGCQSDKMHCSCTGLLECLGALVGCRSGGVYIVQKQDARAREPRQKRGRSCKRIRKVRVSLLGAERQPKATALCGAVAFVRRSAPASRRGKAAFCAAVLPCVACALRSAASDDAQGTSSSQTPNLSLCASVSKAPASAHAAFRRTCAWLRLSCSVKSAVLTSRSRRSKCLPIFAV